ncbi:methyl-accepting chemotaxis protein [Maricaulis sp.]|jgi:methyl-accepting chemotaxis protein|uniref:methyl-accepting chemotaxis protein n=2 Tax=Maricaulis TaxID=74317 RepID=UPI002630E2F2|nr:methyl-accepting chemotaxis protein [Maricaulis sp.]MDF1768496.1 methyl-accepting chemotaxis protein [Maricaulis sp.]
MFNASKDRDAIRRAAGIVGAVADGDFEQRIIGVSSDPEVAEMENAINRLIDRTDAYLRESQTCVEYVRKNKHFRLIPETGMVGSFKAAARAVNTTLYSIKDRHEGFLDLGSKLESQLSEVMGKVSETISALRGNAASLDDTSGQASEQCTTVAAGAEEASANMQSVAASAEELTSSIEEINRQVVQSAGLADTAVDKSRAMSETITGLNGSTSRIGDIVKLIQGIADQTNLLALNATIEAARAGEAGRGFAIVAQEVKTLAGQTAEATDQIGQQIGELQGSMTGAVSANTDISDAIEQINASCNAIATAVTEQSAATAEIARNVSEAALGTGDVSNGIGIVQNATLSTRNMVESVVGSTEILSQQEANLTELRENIVGFLEDVRRVG